MSESELILLRTLNMLMKMEMNIGMQGSYKLHYNIQNGENLKELLKRLKKHAKIVISIVWTILSAPTKSWRQVLPIRR